MAFARDKYAVTFAMHAKIEVNGDAADPLYKFLVRAAPGLLGTLAIKWNFTKFLVDRWGRVLEHFAPKTSPLELSEQIQAALH